MDVGVSSRSLMSKSSTPRNQMRVTDLRVRLEPLASIDLYPNLLAVSTFHASVTMVTCLPAWGCTMIATPLLLPTVARLSDCLQLWTSDPN